MKPSPTTWSLAVLALGSALAVYADPWRAADHDGVAPESSSTSMRRVFSELGEHELDAARLRIEREDGTVVTLQPVQRGHRVLVDGRDLGLADVQALEGFWASLTMATVLRAVPGEIRLGRPRGRIAITVAGQTWGLALGATTPEGAGVYGVLEHEGTALWVLEPELLAVLAPDPRDWVSRRLAPWEASELEQVQFADGITLTRGQDGMWRAGPRGTSMLLATETVDAQVDGLLAIRLDPWVDPEGGSRDAVEPWLTLRPRGGTPVTIDVGGSCPGHAHRRVVDRGPGLAGCAPSSRLAPWTQDRLEDLVHPRLLPHDYGRVLSIVQQRPSSRTLRRHGGSWVLRGAEGSQQPVVENEVFRWYQSVHDTDAAVAEQALPPQWEPWLSWRIRTDSTQTLRLECGPPGPERICRRDGGPPLRVELPVGLALAPKRFADRDLIDLSVADVRAVELIPEDSGVRQSVHQDLGVWRLDAPSHPAGGEALDEIALEQLLATVAGLRAQRWVPAPGTTPIRIMRVEQRAGAGDTIALELHPECVVQLRGGPAAAVEPDACADLQRDVLFRDPLRAMVRRARALELKPQADPTVRLHREDGAWAVSDRERALLQRLRAWRAAGLRAGEPPGPAAMTVRMRPRRGAPMTVELGADWAWARLQGANWVYVAGEPATEPQPP